MLIMTLTSDCCVEKYVVLLNKSSPNFNKSGLKLLPLLTVLILEGLVYFLNLRR